MQKTLAYFLFTACLVGFKPFQATQCNQIRNLIYNLRQNIREVNKQKKKDRASIEKLEAELHTIKNKTKGGGFYEKDIKQLQISIDRLNGKQPANQNTSKKQFPPLQKNIHTLKDLSTNSTAPNPTITTSQRVESQSWTSLILTSLVVSIIITIIMSALSWIFQILLSKAKQPRPEKKQKSSE